MDDVLFNQWGILAGATVIEFTTTDGGDATDFVSILEQENSNSETEEKERTEFYAEEKRAVTPVCAVTGCLGKPGRGAIPGRIRLSARGKFS
jgi:hypothetical protein